MEQTLHEAWETNAREWTRAVRENIVPSRNRVTNAAILEAIQGCRGECVLDLGCGEGWLCRELLRQGRKVQGLDSSPTLVELAKEKGPGHFLCGSYLDLDRLFEPGSFDLVVANFSLLGKQSVEVALSKTRALLKPGGSLLIQTLNPQTLDRTGWQTETWESLGTLQCSPSPWYSRTMKDWTDLFEIGGWKLEETLWPQHPSDPEPSSVIFRLSGG